MIIITCPNCGEKFPAVVGAKNKCPNCGYIVELERKVKYSKSNYDMQKKEYAIRYDIENYIKDHPEKTKEQIYNDLVDVVRKKGFSIDMLKDLINV